MLTASEARKAAELQRLYLEERRRRLQAEQKLAGTRSAVVRLQAMLLKQKAEAAEQRANGAA
jgi:hypothetical protein